MEYEDNNNKERGITNEGCIYEDKLEFRKNNEMTILDFYSNQYTHSTREIWEQRILEGQIQVNGEVIQDPNTKITKKMGGKTIRYFRPSWREPIVETIPKFFKDIILYEDEQLVVLNKPSGLPVLPSGNYLETTLLKMLHKFYKENGYQVDFNQVAPVHRLGRGTSGSILFCKTKYAGNKLGYAMKNHNIKKTYLALACNFKFHYQIYFKAGICKEDKFSIDHPIGPVPYEAITTTGSIFAASKDGKFALSHCEVLKRDYEKKETLLKVNIVTGRPHQIRIHLAFYGHPLVGDPLYGIGGVPMKGLTDLDHDAVPGDCGYLLHSWKIAFPHPILEKEVEVICPPPIVLSPQ